ncbi:MAG TPA: hypothetical protein VFK79_05635 [Xanthobacteraceae bacterium]|nr:hypothetical protein [Xanthobacteraceae bacterium]
MHRFFIFMLTVLSLAAAEPVSAQPDSGLALRIDWEVKNRFRLFRNEADFDRHLAAYRGDGILAAEARLEQRSDGRGWARDMVDRLCIDGAGRLTETCQRDGVRESYLAPTDHRIGATLAGMVPPGSRCVWNFDDGTIPPQEVTADCGEEVRLRVRYGKPTIASVGITAPDGSIQQAATEIVVRDFLIAGLGDSIAAGEGNPDKPVALSDIGFCFRDFLGGPGSQYYRPGRARYPGDKSCGTATGETKSGVLREWQRHGAGWMSAGCHRSMYGYQVRAALELAVENPHAAVTFLPLACSGATIENGMLAPQRIRECPPGTRETCAGTSPAQIAQLTQLLTQAQKQQPGRALDLILLTVGANDILFSGLVANVILEPGAERSLFNRTGIIATPEQAARIAEVELPAAFAKLRAALKPLIGNDLRRVVFTAYADMAAGEDGAVCPGGREGFDVHPTFNADPARLRSVAGFFADKFLPKVRLLATCEGGTLCGQPRTDRMTFVDSHQRKFEMHGFCVRSERDPVFDRQCFAATGDSFESDIVQGAASPLVCGLKASEFRPYAPRARWVRTANDSYFTAMTYPDGLPSVLQPADIHDAIWGILSAVYGGAIHPTAEGHAVMADAAVPAMRALLDIKPPPAVTAEPLPPLR